MADLAFAPEQYELCRTSGDPRPCSTSHGRTRCEPFRTPQVRAIPERKTPMRKVIVVIGPGSIGQAIARRVSVGKHVLLADLRQENAEAAARVLSDAGFEVSTSKIG